jgi:hypothetical protein
MKTLQDIGRDADPIGIVLGILAIAIFLLCVFMPMPGKDLERESLEHRLDQAEKQIKELKEKVDELGREQANEGHKQGRVRAVRPGESADAAQDERGVALGEGAQARPGGHPPEREQVQEVLPQDLAEPP